MLKDRKKGACKWDRTSIKQNYIDRVNTFMIQGLIQKKITNKSQMER